MHLSISESPSGLSLEIAGASIPLKIGVEGRLLRNAFIALRACGGEPSRQLLAHWADHQASAEGACNWCKLEGRILSGQGRKPVERGASRPGIGGNVLVRHFAAGLTAAKAEGQVKSGEARERAKASRANAFRANRPSGMLNF